MVATAKGAGTTYTLEVEREGKRSDHNCNCKGVRNDIQTGSGEDKSSDHSCNKGGGMTYSLEVERGQEVRSWL